jgi:DNA-binding NarL/FixJ family response regulator
LRARSIVYYLCQAFLNGNDLTQLASPLSLISSIIGLFPELSSRVREILALLAQGHKNAEIAERLVIGPKSVRTYVSNIISKLQVVDRAQAILRTKDAGLGLEGYV